MMVVASVAFIFTPDTRGQALVQTVDELVIVIAIRVMHKSHRTLLETFLLISTECVTDLD